MTVEFDAGEATRKRTLLDALYRQYNSALRKFLGRRRLSRDEVADIVQETYCRIHQAGYVDRIRNPKAFLFRVANNVWLNERKLSRGGAEDGAVDMESIEITSDEPGPYRSLMSEQEFAIASAALDELAPNCRDAFVMNRFENMTFAQIALELGLSVSMIEKHVSHAISHMRKRVNDQRPSMDVQAVQSHKRRDRAPK